MKFINNGFVMQKYDTNIYQGIEGDNWYLNYLSSNSMFEDYYDSNLLQRLLKILFKSQKKF